MDVLIIMSHIFKKNYINFRILSIFLLVLIGCSKSIDTTNELEYDEPEHFSPSPIVEIHEKINLSLPDTFDKLILVLLRYEMDIPAGLSSDGKFSSSSIKIKDKMCKAQFLDDAPVSCNLRIHGRLKKINKNKTHLKLHYTQQCMGQKHIYNMCSGSNAERLLFAIHQDLK